MKSSEIFLRSLEIRNDLKSNCDAEENRIDDSLLPVLPFRISTDIELVIIGQDPTVKDPQSRRSIEFTLNLDKSGALRKYIGLIVSKLGHHWENIYATNIFKYFYSHPPAETMRVLSEHLQPNLDLLKQEIASYPNAIVITLGLPVLRLLSHRKNDQVHFYWGYDAKKSRGGNGYSFCKEKENILERDLFPFPHQPSVKKIFYKTTLGSYLDYVREMRKQCSRSVKKNFTSKSTEDFLKSDC